MAKLHTLALAMAGHVSISGVQRKISMGLSTDRMTLQVEVLLVRYILKPPAGTYPQLPENEHLSMRLAALFGIETPPCALLRLDDGTLAYIVERFDRTAAGKVRQEDFCQLAAKYPADKYDGSAELCARLVKRFASEPGVELLKLYRMLLFAWCIGNGDLHLKNLSLLVDQTGRARLTPAYDCVNTRLVIADDVLALPVDGKKDRLTRATWLTFATYCGLPSRAAERVLADILRRLPKALQLIEASYLPGDMQQTYSDLLTARAGMLAQ